MANEFVIKNGFRSQGNSEVTGSLNVTGGITGSISGSIAAPGSTTQVVYNNGGVLNADSGFVYNGGSVGIGTSPNSFFKLHLSGSSPLQFGGTTTSNSGSFSLQHGTMDNSAGSFYSALGGIFFENSQSGYYQNDIVFKSTSPRVNLPAGGTGTTLLWERFRIGRNGITINPDTPGSSYTTRLMFGGINNRIQYDANTYQMDFVVNNTSLLNLQFGGGLYQPYGATFTSDLTVQGAVYIASTGSTSDTNGFEVRNGNNNPTLVVQDDKKVAINRNGDPSSYPYEGLAWWDLHVSGTVASNNYVIGNSMYVNAGVNPATSPGYPMLFKFTGSEAGYANVDFQIQGNPVLSPFGLAVGWSPLFTVKYNGKVGIGVDNTQPTAQLQIKGSGTTSATEALRVTNANDNITFNIFDHGGVAHGQSTLASGSYSHAEGTDTFANGASSHAEGYTTFANGYASHAEGKENQALGNYSHAEGDQNRTGYSEAFDSTLVSGLVTISSSYGDVSYIFSNGSSLYIYDIEFDNNITESIWVIDTVSFNGTNTEIQLVSTYPSTTRAYVADLNNLLFGGPGNKTIPGLYSHVEGNNNITLGAHSHAEGDSNLAAGNKSHVEGSDNVTIGIGSHAEGYQTQAKGNHSHSEGYQTQAKGNYSHAEGIQTNANGNSSHAEGFASMSTGSYSHAEGYSTNASGESSHAEGYQTQAKGNSSHAEGRNTIASGSYSHAEGDQTQAYGYASHAEGNYTLALGVNSHAEGDYTQAIGNYSHAEGSTTSTGINGAYIAFFEGPGILKLASTYGDISSNFGVDNPLYIYDPSSTKYVFTISQSYFIPGQETYIELYNTSVSSGTVFIADLNFSLTGEFIIPGNYSHTEGNGTFAIDEFQHVQGQYNVPTLGAGAFILGNGIDNSNRSNLIFASGSSVQVTGSLDVTGSITVNNTNLQSLMIAYSIALG